MKTCSTGFFLFHLSELLPKQRTDYLCYLLKPSLVNVIECTISLTVNVYDRYYLFAFEHGYYNFRPGLRRASDMIWELKDIRYDDGLLFLPCLATHTMPFLNGVASDIALERTQFKFVSLDDIA